MNQIYNLKLISYEYMNKMFVELILRDKEEKELFWTTTKVDERFENYFFDEELMKFFNQFLNVFFENTCSYLHQNKDGTLKKSTRLLEEEENEK